MGTIIGLLLGISNADARALLTVDCNDGPYFTIQDAVDDAGESDLIVVHACTYNENVVMSGVDGIQLVAADATTGDVGATGMGPRTSWGAPAIISGASLGGPCITVESSAFVRVVGFQLEDCAAGIQVDSTAYAAVIGNTVLRATGAGMEDRGNAFTRVYSNTIDGGTSGASLIDSAFGETEFSSWIDNRVGRAIGVGMRITGVFHRILNNIINSSDGDGATLDGAFNIAIRNSLRHNGGTNLNILGTCEYGLAAGNRVDGSIIALGYATGVAENW